MEHERVFRCIEEKKDAYLRFWEDVAALESPTDDKARVDAVGDYFARAAAEKGWRVETDVEKTAGNAICITSHPEAAGVPVAFSGHMDTVHPVGSFGSPAVRRENGRLYGPGVTDCKGGVVAAFLAMDALDACGFSARPLKLILQSDEETSSLQSAKHTVAFMLEKARDCAAFLNCEPQEDAVILARKGILRYRLVIHGKSVHSSECPNGVNALAEAAHKILELEKMKDTDGLTCSCNVIAAGDKANVVPALCTFVVDIRFVTAEQRARAQETVRKVAARSFIAGSRCEAELLSERVAMEPCERNRALLERLNAAFAKAGLPALSSKTAVSGSDAADIASAGIPCLDGFGVLGGRIHSHEEYAEIPSLAESARRLAAAALYL